MNFKWPWSKKQEKNKTPLENAQDLLKIQVYLEAENKLNQIDNIRKQINGYFKKGIGDYPTHPKYNEFVDAIQPELLILGYEVLHDRMYYEGGRIIRVRKK